MQEASNRHTSILTRVLIALVVLFVIMQLYTLTAVGTKGVEVSNIQQEQSEIKIENEALRAKALQLQSRSAITETVESLQMKPAHVNYIDTSYLNTVATK